MKKILLRLFSLIVILALAWLWVLLNPNPAFAQDKTICPSAQRPHSLFPIPYSPFPFFAN